MNKPVNVIISFDAEFSINNAFADPANCSPSATRFFSPEKLSSVGIQDVLDVLKKYETAATFFTEALNTNYFGNEEMGLHVKKMLEDGHDVQLHAHPCWLEFKNPDWRESVKGRKISDTFGGKDVAEIIKDLEYCIQTFDSWNAPRPRAFRAGNLFAVKELYEALNKTGFSLASNVGLGVHTPVDPELRIENSTRKIHDVIELPVTSFLSMGARKKSLTITGVSFSELTSVMEECIKNGVRNIVILTHVHEYIKWSKNGLVVRKNRINLSRLEKLCKFVNEHESLKFSTFGELLNDKDFMNHEPAHANKIIKSSPISGLRTVLENVLNDKIFLL